MLRTVYLLVLTAALSSLGQPGWPQIVQERLPLLGHRNWIVIADSAYPEQIAPGIETVYTGADQLEVLRTVLTMLSGTRHVRPLIHVDEELKYVAEKNAPGIGAYRDALAKLLADRPAEAVPHEQIIARLDNAGKSFSVLLLKTKLTLPYTSVYLELDCGYWNAASEAELRAALRAAPVSQ